MPLPTPTSQTHLTLDARIKSFTKPKVKWPHPLSFRATPETLARAGFFFTPETGRKSDRVTCFLCDKTLTGWDPKDDPFAEHISHSPSCSWALARCSIEALRVAPESTELIFPDEESAPGNPMLEAARLATFGKFWPHDSIRSHSAKSKHMAKAGFIYTPTNDSDDLASCFYCNLGLDGWESTDDPYHEHQRRRPHCAFFTARLAEESDPEPEPKSRRGKVAARKAQPSDSDVEEEAPAPLRSKKSAKPAASTTLKRAASKSSKPTKPTPLAQVKSEPIDDLSLNPPKAKPKLRKSQSQGQLSTSQSQSGSGKPQLARSQSQMGHANARSANANTPLDEEETPVVARKKVGGKTKSRVIESEEEEESAPPVTKPKGKVKNPAPAVMDEAEPESGDDEEESVPAPPSKTKAKAPKGRPTKSKAKPPPPEPVPEPEDDEPEVEEPEPAPVPVKAKTKAGGKSKAGASKTKRGGRGKKAEQEVPTESAGEESAAEAAVEPEVSMEPEPDPIAPPPKKTRAKKTAGATKKGTKGKKGKARGGTQADVDVESQVESESHAESESQAEAEFEMEVDEHQTAQTPRPPIQSRLVTQDDTPRAGGTTTSGLPIPARRTPSPTRLPIPGVGGARSMSGTPRAVGSGSLTAAETPKVLGGASGAQKTPVGANTSSIGTPGPVATPRPVPLQTSPARPVFGIPTRSPASRPVFGSTNTNTNANANANASTSTNVTATNPDVDTVMASPARPTKAPAPARVGTIRSPGARNPRSPAPEPAESSVPFPRDSSPMTPTKLKAAPAPSTLPIITSVLANPTAATGPLVDMSLAELDDETRALTLEEYVRREMTTQYEALKADCEREIEEFLKAARETRAKIEAL